MDCDMTFNATCRENLLKAELGTQTHRKHDEFISIDLNWARSECQDAVCADAMTATGGYRNYFIAVHCLKHQHNALQFTFIMY